MIPQNARARKIGRPLRKESDGIPDGAAFDGGRQVFRGFRVDVPFGTVQTVETRHAYLVIEHGFLAVQSSVLRLYNSRLSPSRAAPKPPPPSSPPPLLIIRSIDMSDCQVEVKRQDILDAGEKRATRSEGKRQIDL